MKEKIQKNIFPFFIIASCLFYAVIIFFKPNSADVALHYYHAIRLINDGGLYTRWIEVMPPTIYLLYGIPVLMHNILGFGHVFLLNLFVLLLVCLSIFLINRSLKNDPAGQGLRRDFILAALIIFLIAPFITLSNNDREHLFVILCLPWIINKILNIRNGFLILLLAAIGFSIKQYNYLYPILFILLATKFDKNYFKNLFSKENITLGAIILVLNLGFFIGFKAYFLELLPVLLVSYRGYYEFSYTSLMYVALFAAVILFYIRGSEKTAKYFKPYLVLFVIVAALLSLNGNVVYNLNHLYMLCILAAFHIINGVKDEKTSFTIKLLMCMMISISFVILYMYIHLYIKNKPHDSSANKCRIALTKYTSKPYIFFGIDDWAYSKNYISEATSQYDNKNHVFAIDHLWMLPWLYNNKDSQDARVVKDYLHKNMLQAFERADKPYIIQTKKELHRTIPEGFNILNFFRDELDLKQQLSGYRKVEYLDCANLEVYKK